MTYQLRRSDAQEVAALSQCKGRRIVGAERGHSGWDDCTVYLRFDDGTRLYIMDPSTFYFNEVAVNLPTMTYQGAWAIAMDRANARMRAGGRTAWNEDDYNHAVHVLNTLFPVGKDEAP